LYPKRKEGNQLKSLPFLFAQLSINNAAPRKKTLNCKEREGERERERSLYIKSDRNNLPSFDSQIDFGGSAPFVLICSEFVCGFVGQPNRCLTVQINLLPNKSTSDVTQKVNHFWSICMRTPHKTVTDVLMGQSDRCFRFLLENEHLKHGTRTEWQWIA
jgi:hypothetical protein